MFRLDKIGIYRQFLPLKLVIKYPGLEIFNRRFVHTTEESGSVILFQVGFLRLFSRGKSHHTFILVVPSGYWVVLVDNKYLFRFDVGAEIHVKMVLVFAHSAPNVTIVIVHLRFPGMAVFVGALSCRPFLVLNGNIHAVNFGSAF